MSEPSRFEQDKQAPGLVSDDLIIDQTLAALGNPTPPADMEARLLRSLESHAFSTPANSARRFLRPGLLLAAASILLAATVRHINAPRPPSPVPTFTAARSTPPLKPQTTQEPKPPRPTLIVHSIKARQTAPASGPAESFPAPPMPLTQQERLLLRMAQERDPHELLALNTDVRAAQDEEDKASVSEFFNPPTSDPFIYVPTAPSGTH